KISLVPTAAPELVERDMFRNPEEEIAITAKPVVGEPRPPLECTKKYLLNRALDLEGLRHRECRHAFSSAHRKAPPQKAAHDGDVVPINALERVAIAAAKRVQQGAVRAKERHPASSSSQ